MAILFLSMLTKNFFAIGKSAFFLLLTNRLAHVKRLSCIYHNIAFQTSTLYISVKSIYCRVA